MEDVIHLSGWMKLLLWLWVIIGGFTTLVLTSLAAWKSGFHIRSQFNQQTGMREDSTLKWFAIIGGFFAGPPVGLLAAEASAGLVYAVEDLLAAFWWVPVACTGILTAGVLVWFLRANWGRGYAQGGEVAPIQRAADETPLVVLPPPAQPQVPDEVWARGHGFGQPSA